MYILSFVEKMEINYIGALALNDIYRKMSIYIIYLITWYKRAFINLQCTHATMKIVNFSLLGKYVICKIIRRNECAMLNIVA